MTLALLLSLQSQENQPQQSQSPIIYHPSSISIAWTNTSDLSDSVVVDCKILRPKPQDCAFAEGKNLADLVEVLLANASTQEAQDKLDGNIVNIKGKKHHKK